MNANTPCLDVLSRFHAVDPAYRAPEELPSDPPKWPPVIDENLPGDGMNHFPFIYVGEEDGRIMVVDDGRVIWSYDTGSEAELDDVWMLSNGNVLFSHMYWCAEVTPEKERVFYYEYEKGTESHSLQPIGLDKVLMVVNAPQPKAVIMEKATHKIVYEHDIPYEPNSEVHPQFRRIRMTAEGTFILPYLVKGKVVEYDQDFNVILEIPCTKPWSAFKLHNGNIVVTDEEELSVREFDKDGKLVWSLLPEDLPDEYAQTKIFDRPASGPGGPSGKWVEAIGWQTCVRLANGNTVLCSQGTFGKYPQFTEITPDKKVVWALKNFRDLGPATSIQVLSDPGIPENPGECQR